MFFIEEGFIQKARQTVVIAFWGKMAAHFDCVADKFIKAGRANNTVTNGGVTLNFYTVL